MDITLNVVSAKNRSEIVHTRAAKPNSDLTEASPQQAIKVVRDLMALGMAQPAGFFFHLKDPSKDFEFTSGVHFLGGQVADLNAFRQEDGETTIFDEKWGVTHPFKGGDTWIKIQL